MISPTNPRRTASGLISTSVRSSGLLLDTLGSSSERKPVGLGTVSLATRSRRRRGGRCFPRSPIRPSLALTTREVHCGERREPTHRTGTQVGRCGARHRGLLRHPFRPGHDQLGHRGAGRRGPGAGDRAGHGPRRRAHLGRGRRARAQRLGATHPVRLRALRTSTGDRRPGPTAPVEEDHRASGAGVEVAVAGPEPADPGGPGRPATRPGALGRGAHPRRDRPHRAASRVRHPGTAGRGPHRSGGPAVGRPGAGGRLPAE